MIGIAGYTNGKEVIVVELGYGDVSYGILRGTDSTGRKVVGIEFQNLKKPGALGQRMTAEDLEEDEHSIAISFSNREHARQIASELLDAINDDSAWKAREEKVEPKLSDLSEPITLKNELSCVGCDRLRWRGTKATTCIELGLDTMDAARPSNCPREVSKV